jgi:putative tricarboxylic transport membrane protein
VTRRSFTGPRVWGLLLLAAGIAVLAATTAVRSQEGYAATGPRFIPLIVGILLVALALVFLLRTTLLPDDDLAERAAREAGETEWRTPLLVVAGLIAYAYLLEPLGYVVATTVFVPAVARVLGSRSPARDVVIGLALGLGVYVAFTQYLGVPLPAGLTPIT